MKKQYILAGLMFSMFLCCFTQVQDVHSVSISWCYMFNTSPWCCAEGDMDHGYIMPGVPVYSMSFDKPHTMEGGYYVICPNTKMKLEDIDSHNYVCTDALPANYPANLYAWVYDSGNTQISDTQNGFQLPPNVARSSVFSTTCAVMFTDQGPRTNYLDVYTFTTLGDYTVYVDYLRMYNGLLGCPNQYDIWNDIYPCGWKKPGWVAHRTYNVRVKSMPVPPPGPDSVCPGIWVAEASLGGFSKYNPVMEAQDGMLVVSVVGGSDSVQVNEYTPGVGSSGWYDLGGYITSQTKLARDGGSLGVYGMGGDGLVWRRMYQGPGSWSPWEPTCGSSMGVVGPTAVSLGSEMYQVVKGSVEIKRCVPTKDVSLVYSVTDDHSPMLSCSLWTDISGAWQESQTHANVSNGMTDSFTVNDVPAGSYSWTVKCVDGGGKSSDAVNGPWTFTVSS
ncbi:MAG: hypothetical protein U9Q22_06915 [Candidatus Altiarchaeota archaeon]|nr:hypothetical protein [Candidatus Altiarchaeota archaeon]